MAEHEDLSTLSREELERYVRTLEVLEGYREELEAALPECPDHGPCIPYALAWIAKAVAAGITLDDDEVPRMSPEQSSLVAEAFARVKG